LTCAYFKIVRCQVEKPGIFMTVVYLEVLAAIAISLAVLMAFAWVVQQRTGNSGWSIPSGRFRLVS
jgi:hypothetical protein